MLNSISGHGAQGIGGISQDVAPALQIIDLLAIMRRRKALIIVCTLVSLGLGLAYLFTTPKMYTAQATLLIDRSRLQAFRQEGAPPELAVDPATIESQIETLKSESVTTAVVQALKLDRDPEFIGPSTSPIALAIASARSLIDKPQPDTPEILLRKAVNGVGERLEAKRVGLSLAIAVSFTSLSPVKAAAVANEIANAYLREQVNAKVETIKQATQWLSESIDQLGQRVKEADGAVADFRSRNNIVDIGGKLPGEQQLAEATTELNTARAAVQAAKSRVEGSEELLAKGAADSAVSDLLRSETVIRLRNLQSDQQARIAGLVARVGARHEVVLRERANMAQTESSIEDEYRRIVQSYHRDLDVARSRLAEQEKEVARLGVSLATSREALPRLRELESAAQSVRNLYEGFRQRQLLANANVTVDVGESRIITRAFAPSAPSSPRTVLVVVAALAVGVAVGSGAALARELLDRRVRTISQMESATQVSCLGIIPRVKSPASRARMEGADPANRVFSLFKATGPGNIVVQQPFSMFAETIRNLKVSIDTRRLSSEVRSIGVISAQAGEGKTTTTINLALVIAQAGSRVLVIDADLRNPQLTRSFVPAANGGLPEVLAGNTSLRDAIWREARTGIHVLPTVARRKIHNSSELLASEAMRRLLQQVATMYDYVLLDCAPLVPVVDVRASAHLIDGFLMVTAWGETPIDMVERVASADYLDGKLLGTVLSMVDVARYKLFEAYNDSYYLQEDEAAK